MPAYTLLAKVDRIVTSEVELIVEAKDQAEAEHTAHVILQDYPGPVALNPMVHRVRTVGAKHWIPRSIEFSAVKEEDPNAETA